ncbi:MAG TPA: transglutaminaseTgpA domain-containing protein, partial [Leptospiraceae bacterium]|nr:transglutaminaseTgpA domain-containing protein [Leptospiraceae bacterium]
VVSLKNHQDGDYFLTSLVLNPLCANLNASEKIKTDFYIEQKKKFQFKKYSSEIGGDLCISGQLNFRNSGSHILTVNADAMGKSMQGAGGAIVLGAALNSILRTQEVIETDPLKWILNTVSELNSLFLAFNGSMLMSMFLGLISEETGRMLFVNAEHPHAVLLRDGLSSFISESSVMRKLGTMENPDIRVSQINLFRGDTVICGSDGKDDIEILKENGKKIMNEDENIFRYIAAESHGDLELIAEKLKKKGTLTDDLSLISISRNIPVWAPGIAMLFIIIKFIMIYYHTEPNRRITGFLISGFFTFILAVHGTQDRLQFSSLFLCLLTGLKYIDISAHQRDRQYFALSATLLTGTVLLNSRDSVNIMLSILSIPVYWSLSTSGPIPVKRFLKIGLLSFIPAFILMGLSIRVSSRLSLMSTGKARTGLGETVMPGNISELAMNRDPVLKLEADGRWNDVYLRSAVFDRTDGFNWFGSVQEARTAVFPMQKDFSGPTAKIYLRPVTDGWVPTMENIYNVSKNAAFSGNADTG